MANKRNKKGKSSPKGRAGARKQPAKKQVTRVPGGHFSADAESVQLMYSDQYILVAGASGGVLGSLNYKLNSLFQVNATAGAGTPQGVAELQTKFSKYIVRSSRIHWRIRAMEAGGSYGASGTQGVQATNSGLYSAVAYPLPAGASIQSSIAGSAVQKYASRRFDWPRDRPIIVAQYEPLQINPAVVWQGSLSMSPAKLDADPDPRNPSYAAAFGADPTNLSYWTLAFQDVLADTTIKGVWLAEVDLVYTVYAFDRPTKGDSLVGLGPVRVIEMSAARVGGEEKKAPPPTPLTRVSLDDSDVSPLSLASLPDGYELIKRKSLGVLAARR